MAFWSRTKLEAARDGYHKDRNRAEILALVRKEIGIYEDCYRYSDPYRGQCPSDDLLRNKGLPKGSLLGTFWLKVPDERDPRLTVDGIKHLARKLRKAAFDWMEKEVRARSEQGGSWMCSKTPDVLLHSTNATTRDPQATPSLWFQVRVYVCPRLSPEVDTRVESH